MTLTLGVNAIGASHPDTHFILSRRGACGGTEESRMRGVICGL